VPAVAGRNAGIESALGRRVRFSCVVAMLIVAACGDSAQSGADLSMSAMNDAGGGGADEDGGPGSGVDGGMQSMADLAGGGGSIDLASLDLAGLTNCYGVAICDPNAAFCIRFHDGSQAAPGNVTSGPACFEPSDTCANQGQPMNCSCIQADSNLGVTCQGSCVDHGDGTYDCYKQ
jgi:hypothetical protein